jgi:hypothetical protein
MMMMGVVHSGSCWPSGDRRDDRRYEIDGLVWRRCSLIVRLGRGSCISNETRGKPGDFERALAEGRGGICGTKDCIATPALEGLDGTGGGPSSESLMSRQLLMMTRIPGFELGSFKDCDLNRD